MKIIILRHGEAGFAAIDQDRHLTDSGIYKIQQVAAELFNSHQIDFALISPYTRAQETANLIIDHYILHNKPIKRKEISNLVSPAGNYQTVIDTLDTLVGETSVVLIVSHLPLVEHLTQAICDSKPNSYYFNAGSYVVIDYNPYNKPPGKVLNWKL